MADRVKPAPIFENDATLEAALEAAHIPSLMTALVHLTGDMSLLRGDIQPEVAFLGDANAGITAEQQQSIREIALNALKKYRDNPTLPAPPSQADIQEMLTFLIGQEASEAYVDFLTAELALEGEDPYAQPEVFDIPQERRSEFRVVVIGAGMSGLLAGVRLQEAGIPFEIIEKNPDVGGTWLENTYPGCRVDSPNHVYSYSFHPQDWPQYFSQQKVLRAYFSDFATDYGLREHTRFNTEVTSARFDEGNRIWRVELAGNDGSTETVEANAIISAVGQLNRPRFPDIPGRERFAGASFHSAQWQHEQDLTGKRVGVIGTGASAFQFVPIISQTCNEVRVFQRTAPWVIPNPEYFQDVPNGKHWLLNHMPFYAKWFRFSMFWRTAEGLLAAVTADDKWQRSERSVSEMNDLFREMLTNNLEENLADDPGLLAKCIPDYPPGAKRALIDDGAWLRSLKRNNVHLLTDPISEITAKGVKTLDGTEHEFDVLIYATGFLASSFLHPMKIYGNEGVELHDAWGDEPRAYKGITIPGFPNLFCCYGPNTNIVVNGSIIFFSECEIRYVLGCLAMLMQSDHAAMEVKRDVHDAFNKVIDTGNKNMAWGQSSVNTWYKNQNGRITQNWPFTLLRFWQETREPDAADYMFD